MSDAREQIATERLCEAEDALMAVVAAILTDGPRSATYSELANCVSNALTSYFARRDLYDHERRLRAEVRDALGDQWWNYQAAVAYDRDVQAELDREAAR